MAADGFHRVEMPECIAKITNQLAVARTRCARSLSWMGLLLAAVVFAGCASVTRPPPGQTLALPEIGADEEQLFQYCTALPSPPARALLRELAQQNLDVQAAWSRVRIAQAQAQQRKADVLLSVDFSVQGRRSKSRPPQFGQFANAEPFTQEQYEASVGAEYELDLWNRLGNSLEAARLQADAQRMDAITMGISLSAELLESWYDLAYRRMQRQLIEAQLKTSRHLLELLKQRFLKGAGPALDALQQKQQLAALNSIVAENEAAIALQRQQLAVLLGRHPEESPAAMPEALPELENIKPARSFSAAALVQRPDLRAGLLRVQAADSQLAAALAQRLPSVRLSTALFNQSEDISGIVDGLLWRVAGSLLLPLYDGGRIAARIDEADASRDLQILQYRQQLLTALSELSSAWISEHREAQRIADLQRQRDTAQKSYRLARQQYLRGAVDYLRVLNALQSEMDLQQQILQTRRQRLSFRIQFCRALGADWLSTGNAFSPRSHE
jgi:multidrug efflux system outer membrane protein